MQRMAVRANKEEGNGSSEIKGIFAPLISKYSVIKTASVPTTFTVTHMEIAKTKEFLIALIARSDFIRRLKQQKIWGLVRQELCLRLYFRPWRLLICQLLSSKNMHQYIGNRIFDFLFYNLRFYFRNGQAE